MLTRINGLTIVGALFVVSVIGCKSAQRNESSWANEVASNTVYVPPDSTSSYTPAPGEWVCPMHPNIKQSEPGKCSICGMYLERSDSLSRTGGSSSGSGHSHSEGSHSKGSGHGCCG